MELAHKNQHRWANQSTGKNNKKSIKLLTENINLNCSCFYSCSCSLRRDKHCLEHVCGALAAARLTLIFIKKANVRGLRSRETSEKVIWEQW
jgi:hypothetical protein